MNLATLNLPPNADTADVWAAGREHDMRADAYAWHQLLSDPDRSEMDEVMRIDDVHAFEQDDADLYRLIVHDDQGEQHSLFMNTHLACDLHDLIVKVMGPYIFERDSAKAEHDRRDPYVDEDDGPWPGESVMSFYQRTRQDGPLRDVADACNKARKES